MFQRYELEPSEQLFRFAPMTLFDEYGPSLCTTILYGDLVLHMGISGLPCLRCKGTKNDFRRGDAVPDERAAANIQLYVPKDPAAAAAAAATPMLMANSYGLSLVHDGERLCFTCLCSRQVLDFIQAILCMDSRLKSESHRVHARAVTLANDQWLRLHCRYSIGSEYCCRCLSVTRTFLMEFGTCRFMCLGCFSLYWPQLGQRVLDTLVELTQLPPDLVRLSLSYLEDSYI